MAAWTCFCSGSAAQGVLVVVFAFSVGGAAAVGAATLLRVLPGGLLALLSAENPLTPRELEVLRLAAGGAPTREIAERLSLSVGTVRNHLNAVSRKTEARNRIDAIRIARESGWL